MIKNLNGDFETVEYSENHFTILYDNTVDEDYPVHWHNAIEIIMPLQNEFTVYTNNTKYELMERDIIIIPPGELHSMTAPEKGRRIIFQCDNSALGDISPLRPVIPALSETLFISSESGEEIFSFAKRTMLEIYDEYFRKTELSEVKIYLGLINLLIKIRENQIYRHEKALNCTAEKLIEYNERFGTVLKYIEKNYMYDITLDKLADIAGYSKFHFSRIFKQYSELSYVQYINKIRTNAAQTLLLKPDISITEVAMLSGFSSITSFNRVFKEIKHCTPSEFKKFYK